MAESLSQNRPLLFSVTGTFCDIQQVIKHHLMIFFSIFTRLLSQIEADCKNSLIIICSLAGSGTGHLAVTHALSGPALLFSYTPAIRHKPR